MKRLIYYCVSLICLGAIYAESVEAQISSPLTQPRGTGNSLNYPSGTQIYPGGTLNVPQNGTIFPSNTIRHGDGSTTFYYSNGSRITTKGNNIAPSGTYLTPGINGGLRNGNQLLNKRRSY